MQGRKKQGKMAGRVQPCGTAWLGVWVSQVGREVHRRWVLDCLPAALTSWVPQKVRVFGGMKVIWRRKVLFLTQRAGWGHRLAPPPPGLAAKCYQSDRLLPGRRRPWTTSTGHSEHMRETAPSGSFFPAPRASWHSWAFSSPTARVHPRGPRSLLHTKTSRRDSLNPIQECPDQRQHHRPTVDQQITHNLWFADNGRQRNITPEQAPGRQERCTLDVRPGEQSGPLRRR